jgi:hypothetical protein
MPCVAPTAYPEETPMSAGLATDKQVDFLQRLFAEAQEALPKVEDPTVVASVTHRVEAVQDVLVIVLQGQVPQRDAASSTITTLIAVVDDLRSALRKATAPVALRGYKRVITNRYAKPCVGCHQDVPAQEGFAALGSRGWVTVCNRCANETAEQRAEREAQEAIAAAEAQAQAQEAAAEAKAKADQASAERKADQADLNLLADHLFVVAGLDGHVTPEIRIAIPSGGDNDLDFLRLRKKNGTVRAFRVIGGHADQPLDPKPATTILTRFMLSNASVTEAMALYGQELGYCGRCGRHLTDESSRAAGLGPVCAGEV